MTLRDSQQATPEQIADLATTEARLPRLALIGVFGSETAPAALVRDASGIISRVTPGDRISRHTVTAIGADHLVLSRNGQTKVLRLPES